LLFLFQNVERAPILFAMTLRWITLVSPDLI
jgi:hypothetical protein